jgi:hypothetical protein
MTCCFQRIVSLPGKGFQEPPAETDGQSNRPMTGIWEQVRIKREQLQVSGPKLLLQERVFVGL